jgi:hypothetical protein
MLYWILGRCVVTDGHEFAIIALHHSASVVMPFRLQPIIEMHSLHGHHAGCS